METPPPRSSPTDHVSFSTRHRRSQSGGWRVKAATWFSLRACTRTRSHKANVKGHRARGGITRLISGINSGPTLPTCPGARASIGHLCLDCPLRSEDLYPDVGLQLRSRDK
ncbi:unnamed protein product [Pleuronectes platessa]|uniref:Uncharacterized protein n=1 Tax=Pleuronectes platessa TaxID=8262 RepID=A0A9N7ZBE1_PLEPL|nr:unnamed protein product [Pleuronectes platessa]